MKKSLIITYSCLLILTFSTALIAFSGTTSKCLIFIVLLISAIKFLMVSFQFMELKKANSFWKLSLMMVLLFLILLIVIIL